ncbi:MAG TPA: DMT family protein [Rhizomicrobium sp.]|nr:DMT family protein [Rhizomicrobium sp.]
MTWPMIFPILFLCLSNVFMTFAWYGQFKFPNTPLWILILAGWSIAFFEYCFAVPANHFGQRVYSPVQLKTIQEVITLCVFAGFSILYLGEEIRWNHAVAFALLVLAAYFSFLK